ncbi:MAG: AHH domain-containing protein [Saprospiraceae bacterium]
MQPFSLRAIGLALLFFVLFGCNKDKLFVEDNTFGLVPHHPITIDEAQDYFKGVKNRGLSFSTPKSQFLKLEPEWDLAVISHGQSGKEIVVVPIKDRSIDSLNNGRAGAKLQFRKFDADSIIADVVVYVADSTYFAQAGNVASYESFTGIYAFFDIWLNFKTGISVLNGVPNGWVDTVMTTFNENVNPAQSRTDDPCATMYDIELYCHCIDVAFGSSPCGPTQGIGCTLEISSRVDCSGGGGYGGGNGSTGNGNGGNGGTGSGGSSGNGNGNGGSNGDPGGDDLIPGICPPEPDWVCFFLNNVAQDIFTPITVPENLPDGFDEALYKKLVEVLRDIKPKTMQQIDWLVKNPGAIDILSAYLALPSVGQGYDPENPNAPAPPAVDVLDLIDLCRSHGLNVEQFGYLLNNAGFYEAIQAFCTPEFGFNPYTVKVAIDLARFNQIPIQPNSPEYQAFLAEHPEFLANENLPLALAYSIFVEGCKLKYQFPQKSNSEIAIIAINTVLKNSLHTLLDIGGLVPGAGEVCDISNGVIYYIEGDYLNAGFSFGAAVPVVGWHSIGAKYCAKVITLAGRTSKLSWLVDASSGKILFAINDEASRSQLKRIMDTPANHQAHHLVPLEFKENNVVQMAAKRNGTSPWHMNYVDNGYNVHISRHNGPHSTYSEAINRKLLEIEALPALNPEKAHLYLTSLSADIRIILESNANRHINDPYIADLIDDIVID